VDACVERVEAVRDDACHAVARREDERDEVVVRERGHGAPRVGPPGEERLCRVDRPHARDAPLVEQRLGDAHPGAVARLAQAHGGGGDVEVLGEDVGAEVAEEPWLVARADDVEHAEALAEGRPAVRREDGAHVRPATRGLRGARARDEPASLHAQVRVERPAVRRPHEEVLAVGGDLGDLAPREVDVAEPAPAELCPHERAAAERRVEAGGREPQDVTLGHGRPSRRGRAGRAA